MTYSTLNRQLQGFGISTEVFLMDFVLQAGRNEASLPAKILQKEGLDLSDEGVTSSSVAKELFQATYQGELVTVLDQNGEEVQLVKPGETVTLSWARNKLANLVQWIQELGEHLSRKEGWMFSREDLPEVMRRVEFIQNRRDQVLQILIEVHAEAEEAWYSRVDRITAKLQRVLESEIAAAQAKVDQAQAHTGGVQEVDQKRLRNLQKELEKLPQLTAKLRDKFPSVSELRDGFIFSNTTPKEMPSILANLQGNAQAMDAIVQAETAEQGQAYAQALRNGISLMGETIREKVQDLSDAFYGHIADSLALLEDLGPNKKFGTKVSGQIEGHIQRIGVLYRLLRGFEALNEGNGIDQSELMVKLEEFRNAFAEDAKQDKNRCVGNGRDALISRLQAFRKDLQQVTLIAEIEDLGLGGERFIEWLDVPPEEVIAEAPITRQGADVSELAVML